MTFEEFRATGERLWGYGWQQRVARHFEVADRTVRRWAAGDAPIPETIAAKLRDMIGIAPPPGSTADEDRDDACAEALEGPLTALLTQAEAVGWHPAEVHAALLSWAVTGMRAGSSDAATVTTLLSIADTIRRAQKT